MLSVNTMINETLSITTFDTVVLSVMVMLSVANKLNMLGVVMLSVVAPLLCLQL